MDTKKHRKMSLRINCKLNGFTSFFETYYQIKNQEPTFLSNYKNFKNSENIQQQEK